MTRFSYVLRQSLSRVLIKLAEKWTFSRIEKLKITRILRKIDFIRILDVKKPAYLHSGVHACFK